MSTGFRNRLAAALVVATLVCFTAPVVAQDRPAGEHGDSAAEQFNSELRALHWVVGPQPMRMFDNSTLQVPKDYVALGTADTAKLLALEKNLASGNQYFFAPKDFRWQAFFTYSDDGYVKDDETVDADAILKNIQDNTRRANEERRERGYDEMEVTGWQIPPYYDGTSHHLEWAIRGRDLRTGAEVINFNTRILGRGGVMSVVLIAPPTSLSPSIANLKETLAGFDYQAGQRYAEYKPGDKIAKFGLAALITGGAAAVAVKTGLWKVILASAVAGWKFLVAAAVALFGGISRFFKRKTT